MRKDIDCYYVMLSDRNKRYNIALLEIISNGKGLIVLAVPLRNSIIEDQRVRINLVSRWSKRWLAFDRSNFSNVIGPSQNIAAIQKDTRRYRRYETWLCTIHANKTRSREGKQKQRRASVRGHAWNNKFDPIVFPYQ